MTSTTETPADARAVGQAVHGATTSIVAIREAALEPIIVALLARGHVLIEGRPGTGKTLLARTLARCVGCSFNRIQFTNDLMPADIVGSLVWRAAVEKFQFVRGPLFANLMLADEINRTSPRTLSCLLEAMESAAVSVEGRSVPLPDPFLVLATRNPIEFHGTYPVPEAALDRFLVRVELDYPEPRREIDLYCGRDPEHELEDLQPVVEREHLLQLMAAVREIEVSTAVATYCHGVVQRTREHDAVALGASPRAAISWLTASRARAALHGRAYVLPDDLKALAGPVLAHRMVRRDGGAVAPLLEEILAAQPVEL